MRNLDITTLRSFVAVADYGGVTRAAGLLNLTQSAVSMQLKRLEELLGLQLLDRSNRRIALTANGDQLLSYARRMLDINDEVISRLTDQTYEGALRLGVPHDIIYPAIPRVLNKLNTLYPRMNVQLISSNTMDLKDKFARGEIDMIVTTEHGVDAEGETLADCDLHWVGAPNGQAWKQRPLRLALGTGCIFRPRALRGLDRMGIPWEMAVETNSDRTLEAVVCADLAVQVLLGCSIPPLLEKINHGGELPALDAQKINLYSVPDGQTEVKETLAELLRQSFGTWRAAEIGHRVLITT